MKEYPLNEYLAWTASLLRTQEFVSKKEAGIDGGKATANAVFDLMEPPENYPPELQKQWEERVEKYLPTERDVQEAKAAIQWIKQMTSDEIRSQFRANVFNIVIYGKVTRQTAGLAASILKVYWDSYEDRKIRKRTQKAKRKRERKAK